MKILTANRLKDGSVVYLAPDDSWAARLSDAARFADDEAPDVLAAVSLRQNEIADAYLIDADASGPVGRETLRETIRGAGPTVRSDLGKQAESA